MSRDYLDRRRDEIMAAALRCFARKGFHSTTVQRISAPRPTRARPSR